jgi:hypothetical protein
MVDKHVKPHTTIIRFGNQSMTNREIVTLHFFKREHASMRRVGPVVSTSDSRSGVACLSPDEDSCTDA